MNRLWECDSSRTEHGKHLISGQAEGIIAQRLWTKICEGEDKVSDSNNREFALKIRSWIFMMRKWIFIKERRRRDETSDTDSLT
jgi:hypothetical protein